ncbi:exodeoxyribonuclease V subunit beta [Geobacter pickeringii]|uniref:DNA 3'-5' helicase n=2 Tax=Geobacter pickeringii TaxID=345632 RepID=A0A0B5BK55_9BACT|nr:exodeoxyribonuclease V subunit beta [Geobacter pickeringii]
MLTYDNLGMELEGVNLIEASAGTGKTYAIACLFLRLVVEKELLPEQTLVVTFTEAATKELRARIRERLRDARDAFAGLLPPSHIDPFLKGLVANGNGAGPGTTAAIERLDRALQTFDCAAISTIHGFCLRALKENAFESGSLYDTELVADQRGLLQEIADDFWRRSFFGADAELLPAALRDGWTPEKLASFLRGKVGNPELLLLPAFTPDEVAALAGEGGAVYAALADLWRQRRGEIEAILHEHKGLSRSRNNYHPDLVPLLLAGMATYVDGGNPFDLPAGFEKFSAAFMRDNRMKKADPPEHRFFDLCETMTDVVRRRLLALRGSLVTFAAERLAALKGRRNIRFFDDLLADLYRALEGGTGDELALRLRRQYRAALIDEFQDTDPVQYRIFRRIYADGTVPLFLIGDPKQSIYGFRGADIFAYLEARADVPPERRFTMDRNWRSTPEMVKAVNHLFAQRADRPFVVEDIGYPNVAAAREGHPLSLEGRDRAPLQFWFLERTGDDGASIGIAKARQRIVAAVAGEIASLLADGRAGTATIEGEPLVPEDIAVVVRSHGQAALVREALAGFGIPSVVQSTGSLFDTDAARDVLRVMQAVAEPGRESRVRAALATSLFGVPAIGIARLLDDEKGWEGRLAAFRTYHELWQTRGFMTMFRTLLAQEGVRERLLPLEDGERRLTDINHCSEVVHGAAVAGGLGMDRLCAWFGERVSTPPEGEEYQIRLESDEKAVRIVTVHVSKGLEYPIVFCPFAWGGVRDDDGMAVYHDGYRMVADFGSDRLDEHRRKARTENLAENLRLLYVALTRAKYRCYLAWGKIRYAGTSAPAYLLHPPAGGDAADVAAALAEAFEKLSDATLVQRLADLRQGNEALLTVTVNPEPAGERYRGDRGIPSAAVCRQFRGRIDGEWRVASFTSFVARHRPEEELPDRDQRDGGAAEPPEAERSVPPPDSIFAFPRGAQAGIALHAIFEKLDFAGADEGAVRGVVARQLERYGFDAAWCGPVCALVWNVFRAPLADAEGTGFLAALKKGEWIPELEFYVPLRFVTSERVAEVLRRWGGLPGGASLAEVADRLDFRPARGMVRGFIDMVFRHGGRYYLIDWKSNHLGNRTEEYRRERLVREMERELYPLQYLLYTVALDRYLAARIPGYRYETHFGGVRYVFLRGVDPQRPELGIYRDTPPAALVKELGSLLIGSAGGNHAL